MEYEVEADQPQQVVWPAQWMFSGCFVACAVDLLWMFMFFLLLKFCGCSCCFKTLLLPGEMNILQIQRKNDFNTFLLRKPHSRCIK